MTELKRKMASIQTIHNIQPIEGADRVVMADVLGYHVVIGKDQFQEGDTVIYIECDALLPSDNPVFAFTEKYKYRVKIQKLRGQYSMGLCMPTDILPPGNHNIGDDVSDILNIIKYEPPIPANLRGTIKGTFPSFLHKTDEMRVQNIPDVIERHAGLVFEATEKLDGTSMTVYLVPTQTPNLYSFGVCSRNLDLTETPDNAYWQVARKLDFEFKLNKIIRSSPDRFASGVAIQGELIGPGIQKNPYKLQEMDFYAFNVFAIGHGYIDPHKANLICLSNRIKVVPLVRTFRLDHTVDDLIEMSRGNSVFSTSSKPITREGIVMRPVTPASDPDIGRLSFKAINPDYLIKLTD